MWKNILTAKSGNSKGQRHDPKKKEAVININNHFCREVNNQMIPKHDQEDSNKQRNDEDSFNSIFVIGLWSIDFKRNLHGRNNMWNFFEDKFQMETDDEVFFYLQMG